jgi:hypothetical protein
MEFHRVHRELLPHHIHLPVFLLNRDFLELQQPEVSVTRSLHVPDKVHRHQNFVRILNDVVGTLLTLVLASGDRAHIPESALPIFNIINEHLTRMKQTTQVCDCLL